MEAPIQMVVSTTLRGATLPKKLIEEFASKVDTLYIFEELEPVIEEQVRAWGIPTDGSIYDTEGSYGT